MMKVSAGVLFALSAEVNAQSQQLRSHKSSILKNVRAFLGNNVDEGIRKMQGTSNENEFSTIRCFYECVNQGMSAEQCVEYIKEVIGEDYENHEIPNLQVKISPPRPPSVISETYWMIGIPTNIYGFVDCDINGGTITYPWDWEIVEGISVNIPPVSCIGLDANQCCDQVMIQVEAAGIPLVDKNGNCLSCWVHQEPLEPIISESTNNLVYLEHSSPDGLSCEVSELEPTTVRALDDSVEAQVATVRNAIHDILGQNPVQCSDFIQLHRNLLLYGRAFPNAMSKISGLLCGICADPSESYVLTPNTIWKLNWIKVKLSGEKIKSDENCITIYTDQHGLVLEPPKIGGSRHGGDNGREALYYQEGLPSNPDNPNEMRNSLTMARALTPKGCKAPKIEDSYNSGACVCPEGHVDDGDDGCIPDGNLCPPPKVLKSPGSCICPGPMFETRPDGDCICADCNAVYDSTSGKCICESPYADDGAGTCKACEDKTTDPLYGCVPACIPPLENDGNGICVCKGPKFVLKNDECVCAAENSIFDMSSMACVCNVPYSDDGEGGCNACLDPHLDPTKGCVTEPDLCAPPKVFDGGDTGECICPEPMFDTTADGSCKCRDANARYVAARGVCICHAPFADHNRDGICETCVNPNLLPENMCKPVCTPPTVDDGAGECECPGPMFEVNPQGECVCALVNSEYDMSTGMCVCLPEYAADANGECSTCVDPNADPLNGCTVEPDTCVPPKVGDGAGGCECPGPMLKESSSGECICVVINMIYDPPSGTCVCEPPYDDDGAGRCNVCLDSLGDPTNGCKPTGSDCTPPKEPDSSGDCVCPAGFIEDGEGCVELLPPCKDPKVKDGNGDCVCPASSMANAQGGCDAPCTIQDVIDQCGVDGQCGTDYTDCLENECKKDWCPECINLLDCTDPAHDNASAWAECFEKNCYTPSSGSKYKSSSSKYKNGSSSKYKSGGSKSASAGDSQNKEETKVRRRVIRRLGYDSAESSTMVNGSTAASTTGSTAKSSKVGTSGKSSKTGKSKSSGKSKSTALPSGSCAARCGVFGMKPFIYGKSKSGKSKSGKYKSGKSKNESSSSGKYKNGGSKQRF